MAKFEIYKGDSTDTKQCWRWRLKDDNHAIIATGGEGFLKESVKPSIKNIQGEITLNTLICEDGSDDEDSKVYRFAYFESEKDEQWYWRLQAGGNNKIVAIGNEDFVSKDSVIRSIENVREEMCRAGIVFENPKDDPAYDAKEENKEKETNKKKGVAGS